MGRAEAYFETVKVQDSCLQDIHIRYGVSSKYTHRHTHILSHCVLHLIKIWMIFKAEGFDELTDDVKWSRW